MAIFLAPIFFVTIFLATTGKLLMLSLLLILPLSSHATLSVHANKDIKKSCLSSKEKSDSASITLCHSYIRGFLQGALLTDRAIVANFTNEKSEFFQRAYKTRALRDRKPLPATYLAKFCLPEPPNYTEITDTIIDFIDKKSLNHFGLDETIYQAIKESYSCEK